MFITKIFIEWLNIVFPTLIFSCLFYFTCELPRAQVSCLLLKFLNNLKHMKLNASPGICNIKSRILGCYFSFHVNSLLYYAKGKFSLVLKQASHILVYTSAPAILLLFFYLLTNMCLNTTFSMKLFLISPQRAQYILLWAGT